MITEAKPDDVEVREGDSTAEVEVGADSFFGPVLSQTFALTKSEATPPAESHREEANADAAERNSVLDAIARDSLARAERFAESTAAWNDAGFSALAARQIDAAVRAFEHARELSPLDRRATLGLARALKERGGLERSIDLLERLFETDQSDVEVRVSLALALIANRQIDRASDLLSIEVPLQSQFATLFAARGSLNVIAGRYRLAIQDLRKAVRLRPEWVYARNSLGIAEALAGNAKGAEQRFREATRIGPLYADALLNLAQLLESDGRLGEVLDAIERHWSPQFAPFRISIKAGDIALHLANPRVARSWLESAVAAAKTREDRARALNNLGVAYDRLGRLQESLQCFVAASEEAASDLYIANAARAWIEQGDAEQAIEWIRQDRFERVRDVSSQHTLATALIQVGDIEPAISIARSLVEKDAGDRWAFSTFATLLAEYEQDADGAVAILIRAIRKWPGQAMLRNNLAYTYLLFDRTAEAEGVLAALDDWKLSDEETVYVTATRGLLALHRGDLSGGWELYERAAAIAGRERLRERVKVKRDLEMGRAHLRLGSPERAKEFLRRASEGNRSSRPYTIQAEQLLRRLQPTRKAGPGLTSGE